MKLTKFLVQNYRCIEDSGEVSVGDCTVLVGKNESGKTTVLKALHKFNPATTEPFNGLREFPRRRFHEFKKQTSSPVVTKLTFILSPEETQELAKIEARYGAVTSVQVSKNYAGEFSFEFQPTPDSGTLLPSDPEIRSKLDQIVADSESLKIDGVPEGEPFRQSLKTACQDLRVSVSELSELRSKEGKQLLEAKIQAVNATLNTDPKKNAARAVSEGVTSLRQQVASFDLARDYIRKLLPVFIYFENYATLDSRVHLPSFVQAKQRKDLKPDDKTVSTLLDLVGLDANELVGLGGVSGKQPERIREDVDTRSLLVDRASLGLTGEVAHIYGEENHRVEFNLDGEYMRLWVRDAVDGARVELEQRSKGFQWFLSFYVVFMVESDRGHKNSILLLDEPGLHLHAEKQHELIGVLRTLSKRNQILYTSHSPFMIDTDALESIKIVTFDSELGTRVSDSTWATDKDALFPLQAALGYTISQSLFMGKDNLLVEGITDYWLLSTLSTLLRDHALPALDPEIVVTPAGGAQKLSYLTSLMTGQKLRVTILLDSDQEGLKVRDDVVKSKLLADRHVVFIDEAFGSRREAELEDLFPEDYYLGFVNKAYEKELGKAKVTLSANGGPRIVPRLEHEFTARGITFHKTRPARLIMHELSNARPDELPPELRERVTKLFAIINKRRAQKAR